MHSTSTSRWWSNISSQEALTEEALNQSYEYAPVDASQLRVHDQGPRITRINKHMHGAPEEGLNLQGSAPSHLSFGTAQEREARTLDRFSVFAEPPSLNTTVNSIHNSSFQIPPRTQSIAPEAKMVDKKDNNALMEAIARAEAAESKLVEQEAALQRYGEQAEYLEVCTKLSHSNSSFSSYP